MEGFKKVLGDTHVDTLRALCNLGRIVGKDFGFTEAVEIHSNVVSGLHDNLGLFHLDTLVPMDNLALAYFDKAAFGYGPPGDLDHAAKLEHQVSEQRKKKLGREHFYTLGAGLNLSRIKGLQGEIDEALSIFPAGHAIARRNLGETHFGVLFGKLHYGRILLYAKKYKEAENVLTEVIESHEGSRKGHPDRLLAISTVRSEELTQSTETLFGKDHAWVKYLNPQNLSKEFERV